MLLALLAGALLAPTRSAAQSQNTGAISGSVIDAQGSSVINATVTLTSIDEGTVTVAKVDARGEYQFLSVKTGGYIITVSAPTFENFTADSVVVNATENVRLDAKMTRGSAKETVTVEAPSATVDTRSATIATVIDPTLVQNLPVDGNNVVALAALLPGVVNVNAPTTFTSDTGGPVYTAAGSRNNQNLFLFDGTMWNNVYLNTGLNFPPPLMLQEVSVQLVNFKAQYGRNVGSIFNALTLGGTNQIHGKLWEYIQNKALNAADYITHLNPELVQNQFGATVGGPIIKDKLFFYLGMQDLRSVAEVVGLTQLPTAAERGLQQDGVSPLPCIDPHWAGKYCASFRGDFPAGTNIIDGGISNPYYHTNTYAGPAQSQIRSTAATPAGNQGIYNATQCDIDLATLANAPSVEVGTTYLFEDADLPQAEIPTECWNPVTFNFYNKYLPLPSVNGQLVTVPTNLATSAKQPRNDWNGLARVDIPNLPHGHTIDARYYVTSVNDGTANAVTPTSTTIANYNIDANFGGITSGNIGDTWVVRPNLLNIVRLAYKRYDYTTIPEDTTTLITLGSNFTDPGYPTLPRFSANQRFSMGSTNSAYSYSVNSDTELDDSLSLTHLNHNFQFGVQYLSLQYIHRFDQPVSLSAPATFTALGIADFTMGLDGTLTVGNRTNISAEEHVAYFYAQDDWRATARLTLNLGMRYELAAPWYQPDGQSVSFVPGYQSFKFVNTPASLAFQGDPGIPRAIIKTGLTNFAPRVGLAYDVFGNGKTSVRAGFGIFYDALNANTTGVGQPYHYTANYSAPPGSFSQPLLGLTPVPPNYTTAANAIFASPLSVNFADPNVTQPYTEAVNFGFQQRILAATLEAAYVGKFGRHQIVPYDLNPDIYSCDPANPYYQVSPTTYCLNASTAQASDQARVTYPGFNYGGGGIVDNNGVGSSSYNALQVIYTQRTRANLTTVAAYTYSRSLDDQSSGTTSSSTLPLPPNVNTNYGPSDYNATHILNAGWTLKLPNVLTGPRVERAILNDWSFGGIFNARTGQPFTPVLTTDKQYNDEPSQRAPLAPGLTHYVGFPSSRHRADKVNEWYNFCSFSSNFTSTTAFSPCGPSPIPNGYQHTTSPYVYPAGTTPLVLTSRNSLIGPAFIESDFSLRRTVQLEYRGMQVLFRADAFNVWNTPNLSNPAPAISGTSSTILSLDHGEILSTTGKNGTVGTNGRRVQLALVLQY